MTIEQLQAQLADANTRIAELEKSNTELTLNNKDLTESNTTLLKTNNKLLSNQVMGQHIKVADEDVKNTKYGINDFIEEYTEKKEV